MTQKYLNYYKTMVDVDEYLVDLEAQPYEVRIWNIMERKIYPQDGAVI